MLELCTDGACLKNGSGGWGVCQKDEEGEWWEELDKGGELSTTNNRMELMGVIKALEYCVENGVVKVRIFTDSKYVQQGITSWILNWKTNGWKTANRKDVKNKDLWVHLDSLVEKFKIPDTYLDFQWVKGHSDHTGNGLADKLATEMCVHDIV